jgi:hypothetical protein
MRICELGDGDGVLARQQEQQEEEEVIRLKAKRALVGAGARVLFYPTLLYNVLRNRFEADFRWWDRVDQVVLPCFNLFCADCVVILDVITIGSALICLRVAVWLLTCFCGISTMSVGVGFVMLG